MNMKKLIENWALPDRTSERTQLTLRLDFDLYAKLHSLKEVYPTRSVNDMINDILKSGLDEIIEALPTYKFSEEDCFEEAHHDGGRPEDYVNCLKGPRVRFDFAYRRILESKASEESKEEAA
jgi:hypothetical protein